MTVMVVHDHSCVPEPCPLPSDTHVSENELWRGWLSAIETSGKRHGHVTRIARELDTARRRSARVHQAELDRVLALAHGFSDAPSVLTDIDVNGQRVLWDGALTGSRCSACLPLRGT